MSLVYGEVIFLIFYFMRASWCLSNLRLARTDRTNPENAARWISVSHGFAYLDEAATVSSLKMLPAVKAMPASVVNHLKLQRLHLTEDDGVLSFGDKIWMAMSVLGHILIIVVLAVAGVFGLYLKLNSLAYLNDVRIGRWDKARWLALLGFANQVAGLVPLGKLKKQEILFVIFTGEDAEMQTHEYAAMQEFNGMLYKHVFKCAGFLKGFVSALTISATDIQKMVISEGEGDDDDDSDGQAKKEK